MNPPPSPARNPDEECALSLQTVHAAMYPMFPRTTEELTMHDCQPRTPIDPPTTILGVIYKGNTDLNPTVRAEVSAYRDCTVCGGSGASRGVACRGCAGFGRVRA